MHQTAQQLPDFLINLLPLINHYGYLGIGGLILLEDIGLPFAPGETILIAGALLAGMGNLNILIVALVAIFSGFMGDVIGFSIGRYGGHPLVERFGKYILLKPSRLRWAEAYFSHHGGKIVAIARFIDGLRQLNGLIAGLSDMAWMKFLVFNGLGAILWVAVWSSVGYFGSNYIKTLLNYQLYFTLLILITAFIFLTIKIIKYKKRSHIN